MRKRWNVSRDFSTGLFVVWVFGWIPITLIIGALTTPCDQDGRCGLDSYAPGLHAYGIFMICWFGAVLGPAALYGTVRGIRFLWDERPRRQWESVEDAREAYERSGRR